MTSGKTETAILNGVRVEVSPAPYKGWKRVRVYGVSGRIFSSAIETPKQAETVLEAFREAATRTAAL